MMGRLNRQAVLFAAMAAIAATLHAQAGPLPAISRDCQLEADNPSRISSLVQRYDPKGNTNYTTSFLTVTGQTGGTNPGRAPYMGIHINSARPDKYAEGAFLGNLYVGDANFNFDLAHEDAIYDGEPLTVSVLIGDRPVYQMSGKDVDVYSGDVVGRVREDKNAAFVAALGNWRDGAVMRVTVSSPTRLFATAAFSKADFTSVKNSALADWPRLEDALKKGYCTKRTSY